MFIVAIIIGLVLYFIASRKHWKTATTAEQISYHNGFNTAMIIMLLIYFLSFFKVF